MVKKAAQKRTTTPENKLINGADKPASVTIEYQSYLQPIVKNMIDIRFSDES
jgi:hypothetical protein